MTRLHPDIERAALLGWRLHPASACSRAACIKQAADLATRDLDQLDRWASEFPRANWRVVFEGSGIWALDCDVPAGGHAHDGIATMRGLVERHGPLPPRPSVRTGSGGLVLFFRHAGEPITGKSGALPGVDPKRGRLSQTIPPSLHLGTRLPYRWVTPPWELAPPAAPAWLLGLLRPPPPPACPKRVEAATGHAWRWLRRLVERVEQAAAGSRNHTLNGAAFFIGRCVGAELLGEQEAVDALYAAGRRAGLDHGEVRATIISGMRSGRARPLELREAA